MWVYVCSGKENSEESLMERTGWWGLHKNSNSKVKMQRKTIHDHNSNATNGSNKTLTKK